MRCSHTATSAPRSSGAAGTTSCPSRTTNRSRGRTSWRPLPSPRPAFPPRQIARRAGRMDRACEVDKGHGRIEKRTLEVTDWLAEYLPVDWPECHQVFRLQRERRSKWKVEI